MLGRKTEDKVREFVAGRKSLPLFSVFGVDADEIFSVGLEGPAGLIGVEVLFERSTALARSR